MKKLFTIAFCLLTSGFLFAQAPQAFKYQSIVRDVAGNPMVAATVTVQATVHDGVAAGPVVYQETHAVTTNSFGLINLEIGSGTVVSGTFSTIAWGTASKWMQIEADFGAGYLPMGTSQLLSVPYALYSANGTPGPTGATGATGAAGAAGTNGVDGATGAQGPTGAAGTNGTNGIDGATGAQGTTGATGAAGTNGVDGATGAVGATGATGAQGATGLLSAGSAAGNTPYWDGTNWIVNSSNIFNNGGNVGIGTASPASILDVAGPLASGSASLLLRNGDVFSGSSNFTQIRFGYNNTNQYQHYILTRHNAANSSNAIDFYVSDGTAAGVYPTNAVHNLSLVSGQVGIGITNPTSQLHVKGAADPLQVTLENTGGAFRTGYVVKTAVQEWFIGKSSAGSNGLAFKDVTGGADRMIIETTGNVGIGTTTSPNEKLVVSGSGTTYGAIQSPLTGQAGLKFEHDNTADWNIYREATDANLKIVNARTGTANIIIDTTDHVNIRRTQFQNSFSGIGQSTTFLVSTNNHGAMVMANFSTACAGYESDGALLYINPANGNIQIMAQASINGGSISAAANVLTLGTGCGSYTITITVSSGIATATVSTGPGGGWVAAEWVILPGGW